MIDVVRDPQGVRMALEALFEEDFVRSRMAGNLEDKSAEQQERIERAVPRRALSPGYYRWAEHLLRLDAERKAGVGFAPGDLACFEADGLVELDRARGKFERDHPECGACKRRLEFRHQPECSGCGAKFRRKGK